MPSNTSVGFFGKLPSNGDFIQRRVAQGFLDIWDPWLQECVHGSRQALQESWLSTYLTSPVWRFILGDAVCGSGAYAGILVPSVDRVGRYFPMTVVAQVEIDSNPLLLATRYSSWFDALESLVVNALETQDVDLESFDAQVLDTARYLTGKFDTVEHRLRELFDLSRFPLQAEHWRAPLAGAGSLQDAINAFAFAQLSAQLRPLSLWWTQGSENLEPSWLTLRGLPTAQHYGAMLDGKWTRDGWRDLGELSGMELPSDPHHAEPVADSIEHADTLAELRATYPDVQLSAIEINKAAFILRPEIGLWAVAATGADESPDAVRMIADAFQQLGPATTLTAAVETMRQTLADIQGRLRQLDARDVQRIESHADLAVMCVSGAECALLSGGNVQKLRIRARALEQFEEFYDTRLPAGEAGSLMELLSPERETAPRIGSANFTGLRICYERLRREDIWILCATAPIAMRNLELVVGAAASGLPLNAKVVADMIGSGVSSIGVIPLITLEA